MPLRDGAAFCVSCGLSTTPTELIDKQNITVPITDPLIGRLLDSKYEIVSELGAGGMGTVYRARRVHIGDEAAIKVLHVKFVAQADAIERFRREARAAAMLRHPNIVSIYDFSDGQGGQSSAFIVMELLEGESLRSLLRGEGKLEPERAVSLMSDICAGVGAAHRLGTVHRDLKPDNVIVLARNDQRERETIKVVDFGIAKLRDLAGTSTLTETGAVVGTPYYMSPEQCRGDSLDHRSDVYSLGAMFYELLAGTPPFISASTTGVIAKHLTEAPPPLPKMLDVPDALEAVIMLALAKRPEERPANATEFTRMFQSALSDRVSVEEGLLTSPSRSQNDEISPVSRTEGRSKLTRWLVPALALLIVPVIAFGLYKYLWQSRVATQLLISKAENDAGQNGIHQFYWQMTQDEQTRFIEEQSERISALLGPNPPQPDKESLILIREQVDSYVARKDSLSTEILEEGLRPVYSRASIYVPFITQAFNERHVPPVIGLYMAMIESEYHPCKGNQFGGEGLFGFTSETATSYGLEPAQRCDPRKISQVTARYMDDQISEFGADSASVALAIASFNIGTATVRRCLRTLLNNGNRERSYWAIARHPEMCGEHFVQVGFKYVPRFFAAAIVGENPQIFDLQIQPLSTYTELKNQAKNR
jgi:serine/threonine protein kinase